MTACTTRARIPLITLSLFALLILFGGTRPAAGHVARPAAAPVPQAAPAGPYAVYIPLMTSGRYPPPPDPTPIPTPTPKPTATPIPTPTPEWGVLPTLYNGDFEADWEEAGSHTCMVFETSGAVVEEIHGNIFTPPGWVTWFKHGLPVEHDPWNEIGWSQPEVTDMWASDFAYRVHSGAKAQRLFTFSRIHDAGFMQQVSVQEGDTLRLSGWAHAWSHRGAFSELPIDPDQSCSEGEDVGCGAFFALSGEPGLDGDEMNFTFWVGIDPYGGTDPFSSTVNWGWGAHIYNVYAPVPPITVTARASTVTIFLRSRTLWPFEHNDAYWDDITVEVMR